MFLSLHSVSRLLPSKVWLSKLHLILLLGLLHAHRLGERRLVVLIATIYEIVTALVMASKARVIHASALALHSHLVAIVVAIVVVALVAVVC